MVRALLTYLRARFRMIGRCPPHRYYQEGNPNPFPFCLDCGEYVDAGEVLRRAGHPWAKRDEGR